MDLSFIISHSYSRWALPIVLFSTVFAVFDFVERVSAPDVRKNFSEFLSGVSYNKKIEVLSDIVQRVFFSIFGERHFSFRCFVSSVLFSVLAIIISFIVTIVWNYDGFIAIGPFWAKVIVSLQNNPNQNVKQFAQWLTHIPTSFLIVSSFVIWIFWCILPDFLALLKIRIMLTVLKYTKPGIGTLLITLLIDFIVGIWAFLTSFAVVQGILVTYLAFHYGSSLVNQGLFSAIIAFLIFGGFIFVVEAVIFVFTSAVFFVVPVANLFWASMIPSIWLWAYFFAALLTRACMVSRPALVNFLDVRGQPFRAVGAVAAFWISFLSFLLVISLSFV